MQNGINYWRQTWLQGPEPFSQLESGCTNKHPKSISRSFTPTAFSIRLLFFCERKRSVMLWKGQADESFDRFWILSSPKLTEQTAKRVDAKGHGPLKHSKRQTELKQNVMLWNEIISSRQQTNDDIRLTADAFTCCQNYCSYWILQTCLDFKTQTWKLNTNSFPYSFDEYRRTKQLLQATLKGIVHLKMNIYTLFSHRQVVPNIYELLFSVEHKRRHC